MKLTKDGVTEQVDPTKVAKYLANGWVEVKAVDEVIRLKPTVKTRGTAKTPDGANNKGDE